MMKFNTILIIALTAYLSLLIPAATSAEEPVKQTKKFKLNGTADAAPVGGQLKGTNKTVTKNFRVSSGNVIFPSSITVTTVEPGRSGHCKLKVIKTTEIPVISIPGAQPRNETYYTEVQLETYASSPGCTLASPGCLGKASRRRCEMTGEYTD